LSIPTLNQIFVWSAVIFAALSALAGAGAIFTQNILDDRRTVEISAIKARRLLEDQKLAIITRLESTRGRVGFYSRLMDSEGFDFAEQIAAVFRDAGWTVVPTLKTSLNDLPGYVSLAIVGEAGELEQNANLIADALRAGELDVRNEPMREESLGGPREPNTVYVIVGRKR
jgi:hypothetical protein